VESELAQLAEVSSQLQPFISQLSGDASGHGSGGACAVSTCHFLHLGCQLKSEDPAGCAVASLVCAGDEHEPELQHVPAGPLVPKDVRMEGIEDILGEAEFLPSPREPPW